MFCGTSNGRPLRSLICCLSISVLWLGKATKIVVEYGWSGGCKSKLGPSGKESGMADTLRLTVLLCTRYCKNSDKQWHSSLKHCATSRNVAGLIPSGIRGSIYIYLILPAALWPWGWHNRNEYQGYFTFSIPCVIMRFP